MDYLDLKKEFRHNITLFVGYILIAVAIVMTALVLLYQAYGFGIDKQGTVIQNSLTFFSSQPNPANIYVNGQLKDVRTNTRLSLPAGVYQIKLTRDGYRDWQRQIELDGGSVEHYDYPFLFPKTLTTKRLHSFSAAPGLLTQSPDKRWVLIQQPGKLTDFRVYDIKNPADPATELVVPANLLAKSATSESWQLAEWADDNEHVLLEHVYDGKSEYVLVNRVDPARSVNLNAALQQPLGRVTLLNRKYDRYVNYDAANASLQTIRLQDRVVTPLQQRVLAYKTYSDDTVLSVTDNGAVAGRVLVKLTIGDDSWTVRSLPAGSNYLVDLTKYGGKMYVAAGATNDNKVYIYRDPAGQLRDLPKQAPVPARVLRVAQPNYLSFSANAQFIVTENANNFAVYDIENEEGYTFTAPLPLDRPQLHAVWMDGNRLSYISGGKLVVFDYDGNNQQTLMAAASGALPAFAPNYKFVYSLAPSASAPSQLDFNQTPLLIPTDQ